MYRCRVKSEGRFALSGSMNTSFDQFNSFLGLDEYKRLEVKLASGSVGVAKGC